MLQFTCDKSSEIGHQRVCFFRAWHGKGRPLSRCNWTGLSIGQLSPHPQPPVWYRQLEVTCSIYHQEERNSPSTDVNTEAHMGTGCRGLLHGQFSGGCLPGRLGLKARLRPGTRKQPVFGGTPVAYERGWALLPDTYLLTLDVYSKNSSSFCSSLARVWR